MPKSFAQIGEQRREERAEEVETKVGGGEEALLEELRSSQVTGNFASRQVKS